MKFSQLIPEFVNVELFKTVASIKKHLVTLCSASSHSLKNITLGYFNRVPALFTHKTVALKKVWIIRFIVWLAIKQLLIKSLCHKSIIMPDIKIHRSPDALESMFIMEPSYRSVQQLSRNDEIVNTLKKAYYACRSSIFVPQIRIHHCRDPAQHFIPRKSKKMPVIVTPLAVEGIMERKLLIEVFFKRRNPAVISLVMFITEADEQIGQ